MSYIVEVDVSRQSERFRSPIPVDGELGAIAALVLAALLLLVPGLPASLTIAAGVILVLWLSARAGQESRRRSPEN